jgi:hypothetical protein
MNAATYERAFTMPSNHDASNNLIAAAVAANPELGQFKPGSMGARMLENERFNEEQKAKSPGMISQFEADGLMYSIVHNSACIMTVGGKSTINQEFYTAYVQNSSIEDPDECLVTTESFDSLLEATMFIRNHIEERLLKAFFPALAMKSEFVLKWP